MEWGGGLRKGEQTMGGGSGVFERGESCLKWTWRGLEKMNKYGMGWLKEMFGEVFVWQRGWGKEGG